MDVLCSKVTCSNYLETRSQDNYYTSVDDPEGPLRVIYSFPPKAKRARYVRDNFIWDDESRSWLYGKTKKPLVTKRDMYAIILQTMRRQRAWGQITTREAIRAHHQIMTEDCRMATLIWQKHHLQNIDRTLNHPWEWAMSYSKSVETKKACKIIYQTSIYRECALQTDLTVLEVYLPLSLARTSPSLDVELLLFIKTPFLAKKDTLIPINFDELHITQEYENKGCL